MFKTQTLASKIESLVQSRKGEMKEEAKDSLIWWSKRAAHIVTVAIASILLLVLAIAIGGSILAGLYGSQVAGFGIAVLSLIVMFLFVVYFAAFWVDQPLLIDNDELFDLLDATIAAEAKHIYAKVEDLANSVDYLTNLLEPPDGSNPG